MTVWLEIAGRRRRVELPGGAMGGRLECAVDDRAIDVDAQTIEPGILSLIVDGRQYRCLLDEDAIVIAGRRYEFVVDDPRSLRGRRAANDGGAGPRAVKAPMPGRVVRVLVSEGDEVDERQGLVVIEAMKMQNELRSPKAGRVAKVAVATDQTVEAGAVLIIVE
jgi:biotin carboxyl carrier protein